MRGPHRRKPGAVWAAAELAAIKAAQQDRQASGLFLHSGACSYSMKGTFLRVLSQLMITVFILCQGCFVSNDLY